MDIHEAAPVLIFNPSSNEEAEVVCATLKAAGIVASLQSESVNPVMGGLDATMRNTSAMGIFVMASQADKARSVLAAPQLTEEQLTAEEESDPTTLEQAEAAVKHG